MWRTTARRFISRDRQVLRSRRRGGRSGKKQKEWKDYSPSCAKKTAVSALLPHRLVANYLKGSLHARIRVLRYERGKFVRNVDYPSVLAASGERDDMRL